MIQTFYKVGVAALLDLWREFYGTRWEVDEATLQFNSTGSELFDWGASMVDVDSTGKVWAFALVKKPAVGLYSGPVREQAHVSAMAFRDPIGAVDLFSQVKQVLVGRGVEKIIFGQDSRHFFPGVPIECTALQDFLRVQGFSAASEFFDVERDLTDYTPPSGCFDSLKDGARVETVAATQVNALHEFLTRTYPGRWRYDTMAKIELEGNAEFVYALWVDGQIEGFAVTQSWKDKHPISGAVFHTSMGERWGALGPIGVSETVKGKGLGGALLGSALSGLKDLGVGQCTIDWTTLGQFYGKHGFEVSRRYVPMSMQSQ